MAKHFPHRALADSVRHFTSGVQTEMSALGVVEHAARTIIESMPADVWCGVLLDPSTMLDTGGIHHSGFPTDVMGRLFEIEHVEQDDVDNIRALRRRKVTASLLSESTHHDLAASKYYQEILRPLDLADELRVMLRDGGRVWGLLVICRNKDSRPFTRGDLAVAEAVGGPAADALRRSLLLAGLDDGGLPDAPGLILLDAGLRVLSMSSTAEHWLSRMQQRGAPSNGNPPYAVNALATRSRAAAPGTLVRSRVPIGAGQWLGLHAWTIDHPDGPMTAVSIGRPEVEDLVAIILDVYGLSNREREIAQEIVLGRSNAEIARRLRLSAYTVQDHLKAIFGKVGVRSRGELTANLFFNHYLPRLPAPPLATDGRLINTATTTP